MWHIGTGKIVYDPYRGNLKKKPHWWCVVEVDREITRYYRWWIQKELHVKELCEPSWNAHISIIRGEKPAPDLIHLWKKYHGEQIQFRYEHNPHQGSSTTGDGNADQYWVVAVESKLMQDIRLELNRPVDWNFHLTVGRTWY